MQERNDGSLPFRRRTNRTERRTPKHIRRTHCNSRRLTKRNMASFQDDRGLNGDYHDRGSCMLCLEMEQLQKRKEEHQISTGDGLLFTRNCKFCGGRLLYKNARVCEPHGQCCGPNGKYRAKLEEYEPRIFEPIPWEIQEHWRTKIDLSRRTRKYQQLFCVSSIGTNALGRKGFQTHHPGGITLHGATYHVV